MSVQAWGAVTFLVLLAPTPSKQTAVRLDGGDRLHNRLPYSERLFRIRRCFRLQ
jgi:hypothetical protein